MANYNTIPGAHVTYSASGKPGAESKAALKPFCLHISINSVVSILAIVTIALITLSLVGTCIKHFTGHDSGYGLLPKFSLDAEGNIPSFFSALLLFFSGILFLIISVYKRTAKDAFSQQWSLLAFIFMYMAVDEATEIHGLVMRPLNDLYNFSGVFHFSWVIVGIALLLFVAAYFARFFFSLTNTFRARFMAAAIVYICGLIGIEMVGGAYAEMYGEANITYELLTTLEESLEMAGMILLIRALLLYMQAYLSEISVSLHSHNNENR